MFSYTDLFAPAAPKDTPYRKLTSEGVSTLDVGGQRVLKARAHRAACCAAAQPADAANPHRCPGVA